MESVIFITTSQPQERGTAAAPPLGLAVFDDSGLTCFEKWWSLLSAAGAAAPADVYLATNALYYKYFEYEALGRGVPLPHIINSGRSLGDNRVDWSTAALALQRAAAAPGGASAAPARAVLLVAADSLPPPGLDLAAWLAAARGCGRSALLALPGALALGGGGPVSAAAVAQGSGAVASLSLTTGAPPAAPAPAGHDLCAAPMLYYLAASDVAALLTPEGNAGVRAAAAAGGAAGAGAAGAADAGAAGEPIVPLEAALAHLAAGGRVTALRTPCAVPALGALNGAPHALSPAAAAAGPFVHAPPRLFSPAAAAPAAPAEHYAKGYARVGLLGNPSDGYGGKTFSVTIENFHAEAWLAPLARGNPAIHLLPHPVYDPLRYPSLGGLSTVSAREGYSGGLRLMAATLHRLRALCAAKAWPLDVSTGFAARYHTTVPRQVGLAGSSAIITAFLKAAMGFYGLESDAAREALGLTRDRLPAFVLAIESEELGITAGLQDRVVQSYDCAVHMDFTPALIAARGHGAYTPVPTAALPPLFLAYAADPSDSGRIHAPIKQRWLAGEASVVAAMAGIAGLADEGLALAQAQPYAAAAANGSAGAGEAVAAAWARLFARNFDGRRALFGDGALGRDNIRMVEIARGAGASAKFPGSGGAVVGVVDVAGMRAAGCAALEGASGEGAVAAATAALRAAYHAEGYVFVRLVPHEGSAGGV